MAGVSKEITNKLSAGEMLKHVALQVGGKGGGKPEFAQGGGDQPQNLGSALNTIPEWVDQRLS